MNDIAGVAPELGRITTILDTNVNISDVDAKIQVRTHFHDRVAVCRKITAHLLRRLQEIHKTTAITSVLLCAASCNSSSPVGLHQLLCFSRACPKCNEAYLMHARHSTEQLS